MKTTKTTGWTKVAMFGLMMAMVPLNAGCPQGSAGTNTPQAGDDARGAFGGTSQKGGDAFVPATSTGEGPSTLGGWNTTVSGTVTTPGVKNGSTPPSTSWGGNAGGGTVPASGGGYGNGSFGTGGYSTGGSSLPSTTWGGYAGAQGTRAGGASYEDTSGFTR
jgi:hypothetical protein